MRSQNKYSQILFNLFALHQCWVTKYPELLAGRQGEHKWSQKCRNALKVRVQPVMLGALALHLHLVVLAIVILLLALKMHLGVLALVLW